MCVTFHYYSLLREWHCGHALHPSSFSIAYSLFSSSQPFSYKHSSTKNHHGIFRLANSLLVISYFPPKKRLKQYWKWISVLWLWSFVQKRWFLLQTCWYIRCILVYIRLQFLYSLWVCGGTEEVCAQTESVSKKSTPTFYNGLLDVNFQSIWRHIKFWPAVIFFRQPQPSRVPNLPRGSSQVTAFH